MGFSLKLGESAIGLDALNVNDRTLWGSKLAEAVACFEEAEKKFLTRQKSGEWQNLYSLLLNLSLSFL